MSLRSIFRSVFGREQVFDSFKDRILERLIPSLAAVARKYTQAGAPLAGKYFRLWERHGVHLTPVHFYQPLPDTRTLPDELWQRPSAMSGIDLNEAAQLELLLSFPQFRQEYDQFPSAPTGNPHEFHFNNGMFDGTDALVFYCLIRHFRPRRIVEVGCGFSSRVAAMAAMRNGDTELICIEPYPPPFLETLPGLTELIAKPVQEVKLEVFSRLEANDILFIDSSHVVKCGSDVNYLYLDVLPRLQPGVLVHSHDIFLPMEMPRNLMTDYGFFWNEQYLLQAFLSCNTEFEVLFANAWMGVAHPQEMREIFPKSQPFWGGGSFWLRRKNNQAS
ncbi:MAG: class I SAM-dependent methyltransferase [Acidobacteriota bacterium]